MVMAAGINTTLATTSYSNNSSRDFLRLRQSADAMRIKSWMKHVPLGNIKMSVGAHENRFYELEEVYP